MLLGRIHDLLVGVEQLPAFVPEGIEGTALDQAFNDPFVDFAEIDATAEILERPKTVALAAFLPGMDDLFDRADADIFHGRQAETDRLSAGNAEIALGFVDIGGQNADAHPLAVVDVLDDLVPVVLFTGEERGHEFGGIVGLEVCRLIGNHGIGRTVGFVEPVFGKGLHLLPDFLGLDLGYLSLAGPLEELRLFLLHLGGFLLAHDFPQRIGFGHRIIADGDCDLHDLLLIDDDPVGFFQDRFQFRQFVDDLCFSLLAGDEFGHHVHRSRPIQRDEGDDVFDAVRLHADEDVLHAGTLQLEHPVGIPFHEQLIGLAVIERQRIHVERIPAPLADELQRILDDRERLQTEEIEFCQADGRNVVHGELRHDVVLGRTQGDPFDKGHVRYHHAGRVCGCMAVQAFQGTGQIQQFLDLGVLLLFFRQSRLGLDGVLQRDVEDIGDHLGDRVDFTVGNVHRPADVANDRLGLHLPERDDLGHVIRTVFLRHVPDDLVPSFLAEIDVDIGHADAARIEEAFEKQPVTNRIDVGDPQGICDQAARRGSAPRTDRNLPVLCVVDEIRNDQKIPGESHGTDHLQFLMEPFFVLLLHRTVVVSGSALQDDRQQTFKTLPCSLPQDFIEALVGAHLEPRQIEFPELQRQVAALGDLHRVLNCLGAPGEERFHFLRRTEIELVRCEAHAVRAFHGLPGLNAEQNLVGFGIRRPEIMAVVCCDQGQRQAPAELQEPLIDGLLLWNPVFHDFQEEVPLAEQFAVLRGNAFSGFHLAAEEEVRNLAVQACAEGNEPLVVFGQKRLVDSGTVIKALKVRSRRQLHQVPIALKVFCQQNEMAGGLSCPVAGLVKTAPGRDIGFATDDRLDAVPVGRLVETDGPEHVPVIGQGDRRHLVFLRCLEQRIEPDGSVEKTELRMNVQMNKVRVFHDSPGSRMMTVPAAGGRKRGRRSRFGRC
ncbi:MAG: hypothetical protein A4E73_00175 [Syntrophaceae bacterium PtaU1.Bin231]|nr:MAG: hypothetical protein A4E73_00175 [Syntrophaceae bacterium PtaU1.Bin231]